MVKARTSEMGHHAVALDSDLIKGKAESDGEGHQAHLLLITMVLERREGLIPLHSLLSFILYLF